MIRSVQIHVTGIVQGVGFRPFVARTAKRNLICGWVRNSSDGVHIRAEGEDGLVNSFLDDLTQQAPQASIVDSIEIDDVPPEGFTRFEIMQSDPYAGGRTNVSADLAVCKMCLQEMEDPSNRRFHYPFINCTDCGPRFTITDSLPYDRPNTSMKAFEMCGDCHDEYMDPSNRRFHAQPDACFECGPQIRLVSPSGKTISDVDGGTVEQRREASDSIIATSVEMLRHGKLLAIKGLGGFHLACDARSDESVGLLRSRKKRSNKPFALMVANVDIAREMCEVSAEEAALLESPAAPIVLLQRKSISGTADAPISVAVAGSLQEIGIMLPCTPLQHLLVRAAGFPLVMTSGNMSEEPIVTDIADALRVLGNIADAFLDNNRPIVARYDDSVLRVVDGKPHFVRRARGYAPVPIEFPKLKADGTLAILGTGPEQKNTFTLVEGEAQAYVSQHIGDLENAKTFDAWTDAMHLYEKLFGVSPKIVAHDLHPDYLSTKWAKELHVGQSGDESHVQALVGVQHHHAHIAAVLGENIAAGNIPSAQRVIGVALDGTGYGEDSTIWGGELLLADCRGYERAGHLRTMPLPGGSQAIRHPVRMAYGMLLRLGLQDHPGAASLLEDMGRDAQVIEQMLQKHLNCPETSSAGRLFDAVSALVGICTDATFDGEAPMLLEAALYDSPEYASPERNSHYRFSVEDTDGQLIVDPEPVIASILDNIEDSVDPSTISLRFHNAFVASIVEACAVLRQRTSISTVALSGGVFANRFVCSALPHLLEDAGFRVLEHIALPPNDGCISYGQSIVAASRMGYIIEQEDEPRGCESRGK